LTAIVTPELFIRSGHVDASLTNFRLLAGIGAVLLAWKTKNTILTIVGGMLALLLLEFLF